jgi:threonine aldolase
MICAEARFRDVFEYQCAVAMVAIATASNALALSLVACPSSAIFCLSGAHLQDNEAGASLMYTNNARIIGIDGRKGIVDPGDLDRALVNFDPTRMLSKPGVVSVTQYRGITADGTAKLNGGKESSRVIGQFWRTTPAIQSSPAVRVTP